MGQAAFDDVDEQALVGFGAALGEGGFQVQVQIDRAQAHAATGFFGHHLQLHVLFGLQADHQAVDRLARRVREDGEGQVGELDHDLRAALGHAFAGAQKNRHVGPAPVVDVGFEGHKGFGVAVGWDVVFLQITFGRLAARGARAVLTAHGVAGQIGHRHRTQRAQDLEFFVAYRVGVERDGGLHGHDAQQLQQVVLDHVAHGAGAVVKARAAAHAHALGHRDLDALDVRAAPQRLKNRVAKAQHHEVLHRLFAEVVVDAEDLRFLEVAAHFVVDLTRRGQVVAQGFFQHHAAARIDQVRAVQVAANVREQAGRGGQVIDAVRAGLQRLAQGGEARALGRVHCGEVQAVQKALPHGGLHGAGIDEAHHLVLDEGQKLFAAPRLAAQGVDACVLGQVVVPVRHVQRRQEFANREVAHAAKNHHVQRGFRCAAGVHVRLKVVT